MFAQILLPEHVLVPYDKLKHADFFREGKVDGEVKRCILCSKNGGEGAPADGGLKSCAENGHVDKAMIRKQVVWWYRRSVGIERGKVERTGR